MMRVMKHRVFTGVLAALVLIVARESGIPAIVAAAAEHAECSHLAMLKLPDLKVTEAVAVPVEATLEDVVQCALRHRFSRFPVYERSLDNIVGVLLVAFVTLLVSGVSRQLFVPNLELPVNLLGGLLGMVEIAIALSFIYGALARPAAAALAITWIIGTLIFLLTTSGNIFKRKMTLRMYMDDASGTSESAPVRLNGIPIGNVKRIMLSGDKNPQRAVEFILEVKGEYQQDIPDDSVAGGRGQ